MPFRIPTDYTSLSCHCNDPSRSSLEWYIRWLKQELQTANAALDALIVNSPPKPPTPKE